MMPSAASITKPEPSDDALRSPLLPFFLKKSSKNSSNGDPFGTCGKGMPSDPLIVCDVEILTTASISFSAIGATETGPAAMAGPAPVRAGMQASAKVAAVASTTPNFGERRGQNRGGWGKRGIGGNSGRNMGASAWLPRTCGDGRAT